MSDRPHAVNSNRRSRQRLVRFAVLIIGLECMSVRGSAAQLPGLPVLQNAWATPGVTLGVDMGGDETRRAFVAASGWSPVQRLQLSAGFGLQSGPSVGTSAAYGLRVAVPLAPTSSPIGVAMFVGIGGAASHANRVDVNITPPLLDSVTNSTELPFGIAIGWQHANANGGGFSIYASPAVISFGGGSHPDNLVRTAIGADVGLSPSWGVTVGVDFGPTRPRGFGGPTGSRIAVGVSHVMVSR